VGRLGQRNQECAPRMIKPPPAGRSRLLHEERLAEIGQPMPVPPFHPLGSRVLWSAQFAMPWIRGGSDLGQAPGR
jgi:hypothetical protein